MAIETAVNIPINVDGTANVKEAGQAFTNLGDAVKQTKQEAEQLAIQYGINDDRTKEAIKRAGQYRNQLDDLNKYVNANKGFTDSLFGSIQAVAAGFEIAAGATALFGSESEDLNKILIKVQGAMVFAQGLRDLKEFVPAIKAVNSGFINMIKTLNGVKIALAATGIGAIVAVIGLFGEQIGQLFDSLKEKFKGFTDQLGLTNFKAREAIKLQEALVDSLNRQLAEMEARGATEAELFQQRLKIAQEEAKLEEQRLEILSESEDGYAAQVKAKEDAANNIVVITEQENKRLRELGNELRQNSWQQQVQQIQDKKNTIKALQDLDNQYLLSTYKINADYYKSNDESIGQVEKRRKTSSIFKTKEAEDEYRREKIRLRQQKEAELKILEEAFLKEFITEKQYREYIAQLNAYYDNQNENAQKNRELARLDQIQSLTQQSFQIISDLNDAFTSDQQKKSEAQFKFQKGLNVAFTLIDTYLAAQKAYTSQVIPGDPTSIVRAQIAAGVAIAAGLARVAAIVRTQFNKQSPALASSGGGSSTVQSFQVRSSSLPQTQDILSQNRQVYVLEGDITRTQRRVASNQSVSVLGG